MRLHMQLRIIFTAFLLMGASATLSAQGKHFVYLQSNNSAPFFIKMDGKIINSSPTGYIILSNLEDGNYAIGIGFPDKKNTEQVFNLTVYQKNDGYILKDDADGNLVMMNVQTKSLLSSSVKEPPKVERTESDLFSDMLANEVKDSSLLKSNTTKVNPKKNEPTTNPTVEIPVIIPTTQTSTTSVEQILKVTSKDGLEQVYVDHYQGNEDTIRTLIVAPKGTTPTMKKDEVVVINDTPTMPTPSEEKINIDVKPTTGSWKVPDTPEGPKITDGKEPEPVILPFVVTSSDVNTDCKNFASEKDFLKIRMKMAMETSIDGMIDVAKKIMRTMCFSTGQVKNLSYLFLTDEGKYRFFDMAYAFTADSNLYYALESQLSDPYYINRFRAMIQK